MASSTTCKSLATQVNKKLSARITRKVKQDVSVLIRRHLVDDGHFLFDPVQGRAYVLADDNSVVQVGDTRLCKNVLWTMGINGAEEMYRWLLNDLSGSAASGEARRVTLRHWLHTDGNAIYVSCGATHLVKAQDETLTVLDNGADGVYFAAESSLPTWDCTAAPLDPLKLTALRPPLEQPDEVPAYTPDVQRELLRVLLIARVAGIKPLPMLMAQGVKGGGKTTLIRSINRLFLGDQARLSTIGQDERDFWTVVLSTPAAAFDNADRGTPKWLKDAVAALVTGVNYTRRQLYTDGELYDRRPDTLLCISTRTAEFVERDIAERILPLFTAEHCGGRESDQKLTEEVMCNRSGALSWLALTACALLKSLCDAPQGLPGRFVDFSRLFWACFQATGNECQVPAILQAWEAAQHLSITECDPLTSAIIEYFNPGDYWEGRPFQLTRYLTALGADLPNFGGGKKIARMLREARAGLALVGITVQENKKAHNYLTITRQP